MSKERLEEIKEHFAYCMDEGLLFAEQEERLLDELYKKIEEQAERVQELENEIENLETDLWHANHFKALMNQKNATYREAFKQIKLQILFDGTIEDHKKNIVEIIDEALESESECK